MAMKWFPAMLSGNQQNYANACWTMSKLILDMFDETSDVYPLVTEEDRADTKPMMPWTLILAGEGLMTAPGFSWEAFGINGQKLIDHQTAFNYEVHWSVAVGLYSCVTPAIMGSAPWLLTMQYGRVQDSIRLLDVNSLQTELVVADRAKAGYVQSFMWSASCLAEVYTVHGLSHHVQKQYTLLGITFDSAKERISEVTKPDGAFTAWDRVGTEGMVSLKRCVWQIKSLCVLNMDVPEAKATAWLQSLPDNDTFIAISVTMGTFCFGAQYNGVYHTCWIALACEKVGLYEDAIRFADLQLEPDMAKAGSPMVKWPQVIALACKGRALVKLGRREGALAAFQAAITTSKESYNMMQALAYRELANYDGGEEAAVQAGKGLEIKLAEFDGRCTRAEFDGLKIAP